MRGSRGCVRVSELRPWKIQISINIVNLHDKITENTTLDTGPSLEINIKIPSKSPPTPENYFWIPIGAWFETKRNKEVLQST